MRDVFIAPSIYFDGTANGTKSRNLSSEPTWIRLHHKYDFPEVVNGGRRRRNGVEYDPAMAATCYLFRIGVGGFGELCAMISDLPQSYNSLRLTRQRRHGNDASFARP